MNGVILQDKRKSKMKFIIDEKEIELENNDIIYARVYKKISAIMLKAEEKYKVAFEKEIKKLGMLGGIECGVLINNPDVDVAILHQIEIDRNLGNELEELEGLEYELEENIDDLIENLKNYITFYDDEIRAFTCGYEFYKISQYYSIPSEIEDMWGEEQVRERLKWRYKFWKNANMRQERYLEMHNTLEIILFSFMKELDKSAHLGCSTKYNQDTLRKCYTMYKEFEKCEKVNKDKLIENIQRFPFIKEPYIQFLRLWGDKNNDLEQYAKSVEIPIVEIKHCLLNEFCDLFKNVNLKDEDEVKDTYEKICEKKKFLGINVQFILEKMLKDSIEQFDIQHRTINGIVYESEEEAKEVQERSFEGVEYKNIQMAKEAKKEVDRIRFVLSNLKGKERYDKYVFLSQQIWHSESAKRELEKIKNIINEEYIEVKSSAKSKIKRRKKFIICTFFLVICIVILGFLISSRNILLIFLGVGLFLAIFWAWKSKKEELKKSQQAERILNDWSISEATVKMIGTYFGKQNSKKKFCRFCGSEIKREAKFCVFCGKKTY